MNYHPRKIRILWHMTAPLLLLTTIFFVQLFVFSDSVPPMKAQAAISTLSVVLTPTPTDTLTPTSTPTSTPDSIPLPIPSKSGMTWLSTFYFEKLDVSYSRCWGQATSGGLTGCDAYNGDTACTESLPILCVLVDDSPRPAYDPPPNNSGIMPDEYYRGWLNGRIAATEPIIGNQLTSAQAADDLCHTQLGPGYRMAEHHDGLWLHGMDATTYTGDTWPDRSQLNSGGWGFFSYGKVPSDTRYWVNVIGTNANCWDPSPTATPTPTETATPTPTDTSTPTPTPTTPLTAQLPLPIPSKSGMTWLSTFYFEKLDVSYSRCWGQATSGGLTGCDAYNGDTACTESLPILCVLVDDSPRPAYDPPPNNSGVMPDEYYRGWLNGRIAATEPIIGNQLTSAQAADDLCRTQLGPGYRMAEHHDGLWLHGMDATTYTGDTWPDRSQLNNGGWGFFSYGKVPSDTRYWVNVIGTDANCWDPSLNHPSDYSFNDSSDDLSNYSGIRSVGTSSDAVENSRQMIRKMVLLPINFE